MGTSGNIMVVLWVQYHHIWHTSAHCNFIFIVLLTVVRLLENNAIYTGGSQDKSSKSYIWLKAQVSLWAWELAALLDSSIIAWSLPWLVLSGNLPYFTFLIKRQDLIIMKSFQDSDLKLYIMVSPKFFCINFVSKYCCCTAKFVTYCCPYSECFFRLYLSTKAAVTLHHHVFATAQYYYHSCIIWFFVPWVLLSRWPL